jgi:hypothetical protein
MPLCAVAHKAGWEFNTVLFLRIVVLAGRSVQSSRLSGFDLLRDEARKPIVHLHLTSVRELFLPRSSPLTVTPITVPQSARSPFHKMGQSSITEQSKEPLKPHVIHAFANNARRCRNNEAGCCRANSAPFCGLICGLKSRQSCC